MSSDSESGSSDEGAIEEIASLTNLSQYCLPRNHRHPLHLQVLPQRHLLKTPSACHRQPELQAHLYQEPCPVLKTFHLPDQNSMGLGEVQEGCSSASHPFGLSKSFVDMNILNTFQAPRWLGCPQSIGLSHGTIVCIAAAYDFIHQLLNAWCWSEDCSSAVFSVQMRFTTHISSSSDEGSVGILAAQITSVPLWP